MKKFILIILILICFGLSCLIDKNPVGPTDNLSSKYFPLSIGNTWYYDYPKPQTNPWAMRTIEDAVIKNNKIYYLWTYGEDVDVIDIIRADKEENIFIHKDGKEYLWFDFSQDSGSTYIYMCPQKFGGNSYYYRVLVRTNITCETPAGLFNNCIEFLFDIPQVKDEEKIYTFAPYVGLIRLVNNGWSTQRLTCAIIDGITITTPTIFHSGKHGDEESRFQMVFLSL